MSVLFICTANKQRSKTAENYFAATYPDYEFLSAVTNQKNCGDEGTIELTEDLLIWADIVYVMERKHLEQIQKHTGCMYYSKMRVLDISDIYKYDDGELIKLLEDKVTL